MVVQSSAQRCSSWEDVYWLACAFHRRVACLDSKSMDALVEEAMTGLKQMQEMLLENCAQGFREQAGRYSILLLPVGYLESI